MCTIHRFKAEHKLNHMLAISEEWMCNPDGCVILELDNNVIVGMLKTLCRKTALQYIRDSLSADFIVHLRASTGSNNTIVGVHGFTSPCGEWVYVHNGVIYNCDAYCEIPYVDSLAIGEWLKDKGVDDIHGLSMPFRYAMCIAVNVTTDTVLVHASENGTLHYNPETGCLSTKSIKGCDMPVTFKGWHVLSKGKHRGYVNDVKYFAKRKTSKHLPTHDMCDCEFYGYSHAPDNMCSCGGTYHSTPTLGGSDEANMFTCDTCGDKALGCDVCGKVID